MAEASSIPYNIRPNKVADRELFLSALSCFSAIENLKHYQYIGLGGPFLEDFKLIHIRLGLKKMVCVESEMNTHLRQKFNAPLSDMKFVHGAMEWYLDENEINEKSIIWLDFTAPGELVEQIMLFAVQASRLPIGSIVRLTLNANNTSLGTKEDAVKEDSSYRDPAKLKEWRMERFKGLFGDLTPSTLSSDEFTYKAYGKTLLRVLKLAVEREILGLPRQIKWLLCTHYADGQPMVTAMCRIAPENESEEVEKRIQEWEFYSTPNAPLTVDLPSLSAKERLEIGDGNREINLDYTIPSSKLSQDPVAMMKRFYRVYPHFSRVEL